MKTIYSFSMAMAVVLAFIVSSGCEGHPTPVDRQAPSLTIDARQDQILVGETTTVFAQTANLLGREAEIRWGTTIGEVTPARSGRVAQFTSEIPGTAIVTAEINIEGQILRDTVNIVVNPME